MVTLAVPAPKRNSKGAKNSLGAIGILLFVKARTQARLKSVGDAWESSAAHQPTDGVLLPGGDSQLQSGVTLLVGDLQVRFGLAQE